MKTKIFRQIFQAISGIGTEVLYTLLIMLAAFVIGFITLSIK